MTNLDTAVAKVRRDLGDYGNPFTDTFVGQGTDNGKWDLSETQVSGYRALHLSGGVTTLLVEGTDYDVDRVDGILFLKGARKPLPKNDTLIFSGVTYGMFTDTELQAYVNDAFLQHSVGRSIRARVRDQAGFIRYIEREMRLEDLGAQETFLVGMLATIETLWALTTDASTDIDIHAPDGTSIIRSQRYAQMRNQISVLEERYTDLCAQLNVGIHRVETLNLRRVSRSTGRLVPMFEDREYDDYSMPRRILPPVDNHYADEGDIPSSMNTGFGW